MNGVFGYTPVVIQQDNLTVFTILLCYTMPTKTPQPQVRAIIYTRAKAHNYASNTSDQEQKCKAFAQQQDMEIVDVVHEKLV